MFRSKLLATSSVAALLVGLGVGSASTPAAAASAANTRFAARTLRVLEGDAPGAEVEAVASQLDGGTARRTVVRDRVLGDRYQDEVIDELYDDILDRDVDPDGRTFWLKQLDTSQEYSMRANLLGSAEFYADAGGTNQGFVTGVFRIYLERTPDPSGLAYWSNQAGATPKSRASAALKIIKSAQARKIEANRLFNQVLSRTADPMGLAHYAGRLNTHGIETITIDLAASNEAYNGSQVVEDLYVLFAGNTVGVHDAETLASTGPSTTFAATGATAQLGITAGTSLVAIEVRPYTGVLYGLGSDGQLYSLNQSLGTASKIGAPIAALAGAEVDLDFNPTVDRLRIVTGSGLNLRVNPDTGAVAATDTPLAYAGGDRNAGQAPSVAGAGYTNSQTGTPLPSARTLYDIDRATASLVTQVPPNDGTLNTVGELGVDPAGPTPFDISPTTKRAWALLKDEGEGYASYRVELSTGRAFQQSAPLGDDVQVLGAALRLAPPTSTTGQGTLLASSGSTHTLTHVALNAPGTVLATETISGVAAETTLVGIDVRSATGTLYALGSNGQVYVLGAPKAATPTVRPAEPVGAPVPAVATDAAGFDFNPAVDRIRFVSGTTSSVLNPNTGALTPGAAINYPSGDPGFETTPDVRSAGYLNPVRGGVPASTALLVLDSERDVLASQNVTTGALTTVGALGGNIGTMGGFDIDAGAVGYAVQSIGGSSSRLYVVNTTTGGLTTVGDLPAADYVGFALT